MSLRVTEIFFSVQGETSRSGLPCAFVRFTGCDLRCGYCDTAYAFHGGQWMERSAVIDELARFPTRFVTLTGGEPLLQKELPQLAQELLERGYLVSVETHGQRSVAALPKAVVKIVDLKTPGSGEQARDFAVLDELDEKDEIKFVICSRKDFDWSAQVVKERGLESRFHLLFSPSFGVVEPRDLSGWLLESGIRARLNLQIHKYIWGPDVPGV